jgi:hypothetical protein
VRLQQLSLQGFSLGSVCTLLPNTEPERLSGVMEGLESGVLVVALAQPGPVIEQTTMNILGASTGCG